MRINLFHKLRSQLREIFSEMAMIHVIARVMLAIGLLVVLASGLTACKKEQTQQAAAKKQTIITVKTQSVTKKLYFSGTIQPIQINTVVSPVDGTIRSMDFRYGHRVNKGHALVTIGSATLQKNYRDSLTSYLKAKSDYQQQQASFVGTAQLWKAGIVTQEEYEKDKQSLASSELALLNAKLNLLSTTKRLSVARQTLDDLKINDFSQIESYMEKSIDQLSLSASASGIALFPEKSGENKEIYIGDSVKQGQVIVNIGNLKGIKINISVSEMDIDRIKAGLPVRVTNDALPSLNLTGKITSVAAQATKASDGGGEPSFEATVEVPTLTDAERKLIRVGMNATVEIDIASGEQIMLPIKAVTSSNGQSTVQLLKNGQPVTTTITTGATTLDSVVVTGGIQVGDEVIVDN